MASGRKPSASSRTARANGICRERQNASMIARSTSDTPKPQSSGGKPRSLAQRFCAPWRARQSSKTLDAFAGERFDYVITVCDRANESCPITEEASGRARRRDPASRAVCRRWAVSCGGRECFENQRRGQLFVTRVSDPTVVMPSGVCVDLEDARPRRRSSFDQLTKRDAAVVCASMLENEYEFGPLFRC